MIWALAVILGLLWALAVSSSYYFGGYIHVLVAAAAVMIGYSLLRRRGRNRGAA